MTAGQMLTMRTASRERNQVREVNAMQRAFLVLLCLATPCWADGLGPNVVNGIIGFLSAWLGGPLLGVIFSELSGMRAKGCLTMVGAFAIGVVGSTACLYTLVRWGPFSSFALICLVAGVVGAGSALWAISRNRQKDLSDPPA